MRLFLEVLKSTLRDLVDTGYLPQKVMPLSRFTLEL